MTAAGRSLTENERAVAEWLLSHGTLLARAYMPQLSNLRVVGQCECGCPTINVRALEGTAPAEPCENPVAEAFGKVGDKAVGVMLLQRNGLLACLEVYDLSEIERPYGLPHITTLEPAQWIKVGR